MALPCPCPMDWGLSMGKLEREIDKSIIVMEGFNTLFSKTNRKSRKKKLVRIPTSNQPDLHIWVQGQNEHCVQQQNKHSSCEAMDNLPNSTILVHKITFKTFQGIEIIQSMFFDYTRLSSKTTIKKLRKSPNIWKWSNGLLKKKKPHKSKKKLQ